jgi:hypothetical protein
MQLAGAMFGAGTIYGTSKGGMEDTLGRQLKATFRPSRQPEWR